MLAAIVLLAIGEVFNIGGGSRVVLAEVINIMEQIVGHPIKKNFVEQARGNALPYQC